MLSSDFRRNLIRYCEDHSSDESDLLYHLRRETYLKTMAPQMLSGHLQGNLLRMISAMVRPSYVVEIGTFTGYATLCLAEGLVDNGRLITIEANPELAFIAKPAFEKSPYASRIEALQGDAKQIIDGLEGGIDLLFIDAGKKDYELYYDALFDKVRPGGFILADNVLWDGKVVSNPSDSMTKVLMQFNQKIKDDKRVEKVILPFRDGLSIIRKK